jgi:hypothetical protein
MQLTVEGREGAGADSGEGANIGLGLIVLCLVLSLGILGRALPERRP